MIGRHLGRPCEIAGKPSGAGICSRVLGPVEGPALATRLDSERLPRPEGQSWNERWEPRPWPGQKERVVFCLEFEPELSRIKL